MQLQTAQRLRRVVGRPFTKGKDSRRCAKPPGRPPAIRFIPDILKRIGEEPPAADLPKLHDPEDPTFREYVLRKVWHLAGEGEQWATEFIAERTEGRVPNVTKFSLGNSLASMAEDALAERNAKLDEQLKDSPQ